MVLYGIQNIQIPKMIGAIEMLNNVNIENPAVREKLETIIKANSLSKTIEDAMDEYEVVDTRDTVQDFIKNFSEKKNFRHHLKTEFTPFEYWHGEVQIAKGTTRRDFTFIPDIENGFNVVIW